MKSKKRNFERTFVSAQSGTSRLQRLDNFLALFILVNLGKLAHDDDGFAHSHKAVPNKYCVLTFKFFVVLQPEAL